MKVREQFRSVISITYLFAAICYMAIGMIGYLAWGTDANDLIILLFDHTVFLVIKAMYAICLALSTPV